MLERPIGDARPVREQAGPAFVATEAAGLVHLTDGEPGIRRRRAGKGFTYLDPDGRKVADGETLSRIRSLAIPPAWTDVWISPLADSHMQATGRDERGRKQYRYHPEWTACRDEVKFGSLAAFASALPNLRGRVEADLGKRGLTRDRVLASVVWLLDNSMIRIGNPSYSRDNGSFGLTTLRGRHVAIEGSTLRFAFRGKAGKEWRLRIADRRIARVVRTIQDLPGQHLFQYLDEEGGRRQVHSQDVNGYIREVMGAGFSSKHFRTWGGTVRAAGLLAETPRPENGRAAAVALNAAIDRVAARLGNTRAVCRQCYIHPLVIDSWNAGQLGEELARLRARMRRDPAPLSEEEAVVLRWLERKEG